MLLDDLAAMVEAGTLRPVIDRRYPLAQTADAHRYVDSGRKQGNVIIDVADASGASGASSDQEQIAPSPESNS